MFPEQLILKYVNIQQYYELNSRIEYHRIRTTNLGSKDTVYSAVGIATCYGLDGPGIESLSGRDFPHPSRPTLRSTQPPMQWVPGLFAGSKTAGV